MGIDFVLFSRPSSKHDASVLSLHRALPGSLHARRGSRAERLKRRSQAVAARGGYQSSSIFLHCRHRDQHPLHHHHYLHTEVSTDLSCHGFTASASGHVLDIDESFCCEPLSVDNFNSFPSVDWKQSTINLSRARGGVVAGVGLPLSLRMLKRKQQGLGKVTLTSGLVEVGNSLLKAFSSMVFIMKELQSHCLHIQRQFFKQEREGLLSQVHREMQISFLWLFQQVFSCTPELMVLLMVLLADFTAFSMASSMPMCTAMSACVPSPVTDVSAFVCHMSGAGNSIQVSLERVMFFPPPLMDSGSSWTGNGGKKNHGGYPAAGCGDHKFDTSKVFSSIIDVNTPLFSVEDSISREVSSMDKADSLMKEGFDSEGEPLYNRQIASANEFSAMAAALAFEELNTGQDILSGSSSCGSDQDMQKLGSSRLSSFSPIDHAAAEHFEAPFTASVEDDSYTCYDRTDLAYQYAISSDTTNSMLLANYAQFLFLVLKDHDRAENLFRRAVQCDPLDGDAISRFASFLWLARRDLSAAGNAYQAAVSADPCNSFHAADYAHFLWNSGQ